MAYNFGTTNSERRLSIPDHVDFTLPSGGDALIAALIRPEDNGNFRYIFTHGAWGTQNCITLYVDNVNTVNATYGFATIANTVTPLNVGTWYWVYLVIRAGQASVGVVEWGGSATEGAAANVSAQFSNSSDPIYIGSTVTNTLHWRGGIDRLIVSRSAGPSAAVLQTLAAGTLPENSSFAANIDINFNLATANDATVTDSVSNHVATREGIGWGSDIASPYGGSSVALGIREIMKDVDKNLLPNLSGLTAIIWDGDMPSPSNQIYIDQVQITNASSQFEVNLDGLTSGAVGDPQHLYLIDPSGGNQQGSIAFTGTVLLKDLNA